MLSTDQKRWIETADTFFVGSQSNEKNMDASHRGGPSGFVEVLDEKTLKIPDYQGNSLYNTLGNMHQNPHAGLLFIDFEHKKTLQLTGNVSLLFDQTTDEDMEKTTGTGRYWVFSISDWIETNHHHQVDWEFISYSPFNPQNK